mmetsp:Transcript_69785/g.157708  ORF Transcript_69785/g.157708 Transcript_69785/m.157708 type:complete len:142 (+) Transcript_69785:1598-2023(+)
MQIMQNDNETAAKRADVEAAREARLLSEGASKAETALLREKSIADERAKRAASEAALAVEDSQRKRTAAEAEAYKMKTMADADAQALLIREKSAADDRAAQNDIALRRAEAEQKTAEANAATARIQMEMMKSLMNLINKPN